MTWRMTHGKTDAPPRRRDQESISFISKSNFLHLEKQFQTHPRSSGIRTGYWSPERKETLVQCLAQYEDTGLTPEEIRELRREDNRYQTFNPD